MCIYSIHCFDVYCIDVYTRCTVLTVYPVYIHRIYCIDIYTRYTVLTVYLVCILYSCIYWMYIQYIHEYSVYNDTDIFIGYIPAQGLYQIYI